MISGHTEYIDTTDYEQVVAIKELPFCTNSIVSDNFCHCRLKLICGKFTIYKFAENGITGIIYDYLKDSMRDLSKVDINLMVFFDNDYKITRIFIVLLSDDVYMMVPFEVIDGKAIFSIKLCIFNIEERIISEYGDIEYDCNFSFIAVEIYYDKFIAVDSEHNLWSYYYDYQNKIPVMDNNVLPYIASKFKKLLMYNNGYRSSIVYEDHVISLIENDKIPKVGIIPYDVRMMEIESIDNNINGCFLNLKNEDNSNIPIVKKIVIIDSRLIEILVALAKENIITIVILKFIMINLYGNSDCIKELLTKLLEKQFLIFNEKKYNLLSEK